MPRTLDRAGGVGQMVIEPSPISTWFGIGGVARQLAKPRDVDEVRACVEMDGGLRVLGDGANLLVEDEGIDGLVLDTRLMCGVEWDEASGVVRAQAGVNLPKLVVEAVRRGLGGIEGLAGIPASIGGATIMNAGGAFGTCGNVVARVYGVDRAGECVALEREEIAFGYRHSGLNELVVTEVELQLTPSDPVGLRAKLKEVMAYKKSTQPMAADSAGCVFRNPTLCEAIDGIGEASDRVSAGMLIDRAGCKGLCVGGATVSDQHANFIVTESDAKARDVMRLMDLVTERVNRTFQLTLNPELVLWRNDS